MATDPLPSPLPEPFPSPRSPASPAAVSPPGTGPLRAFWQWLHAAFHRPETRVYQVVQGTVWVLIGLSVVLFAVDFLLLGAQTGAERAGHRWSAALAHLDRIILVLFALELILRVATYRPPRAGFFVETRAGHLRTHLLGRLRFLAQPLQLIDLVTVMALIPELRGLRALRLLRLVRTSKLFRYSNPFQGLERAFRDNAMLFGFAFSLFGLTVTLGGTSLYLLEAGKNPVVEHLGDGIWWGLVTVTTVGFGDISPVTAPGRVVGGVLMIAGMFNLALFAGIVGSTLLNAVLSIREEQFRMTGTIDHVIVCGYTPGARMLLDALTEELDLERRPVVLFGEGERPKDVPPTFLWTEGDPTKESELDKVRLTHARAVVLVGSRAVPPQQADAITILTAFTVRSYLAAHEKTNARRREPLYVVAEILEHENVDHARAAGANEVIETTRLGFSLLSHALLEPGTAAIMGRVASAGAHSVFIGSLPPRWGLVRTFGEAADLAKARAGALVIGIRDRATGTDRINPPDDLPLGEAAGLIYLAEGPVLTRPSAASPEDAERPEEPGEQETQHEQEQQQEP